MSERPSPQSTRAVRVNEQPLQFGSDAHLFGVLSTPDQAALSTTALIIPNAGVLHRIGPHRLHVNLARRAAAAGVPALRMDISGIGDSTSAETGTTFRATAVRDLRAAMDSVTRTLGVQRFILFGVCSGADNALATALEDSRVHSIAVVDPICYVSPQARLRKLAGRLSELGGVRESLRWGLSKVAERLERYASAEGPSASAPATQQGREVPDRFAYESSLHKLVDQGTTMHAIFSGAMGERYNGQNQLFEVFPALRGRISCHYFPNSNHTFADPVEQRQLIAVATSWIQAERSRTVKQLQN